MMHFFITCVNSLNGAVRSAAALRGGFNRNIESLPTMKARENTAGVVSITGDWTTAI